MSDVILRKDPNDETKTIEVPVFKAFENEEEFNKTVQSFSSKAKGEILNELGIKSVAEFKEKYSGIGELDKIKSALTEKETLLNQKLAENTEWETKYKTLADEHGKTVETLVLSQFNVPEAFKEDFRILAKAGVSEEKTFEQSAKEVFERLNIVQTNNRIQIGGDKTKLQPIGEDELKAKLRKL